jgi:hypothetical protein
MLAFPPPCISKANLYQCPSEIQQLHLSLRKLKIGTYVSSSGISPFHPIATATLNTPVFDVVHMFSERSISAVPIIDEDGIVVDMYETVDVMVRYLPAVGISAYSNADTCTPGSISESGPHRFRGPQDALARLSWCRHLYGVRLPANSTGTYQETASSSAGGRGRRSAFFFRSSSYLNSAILGGGEARWQEGEAVGHYHPQRCIALRDWRHRHRRGRRRAGTANLVAGLAPSSLYF